MLPLKERMTHCRLTRSNRNPGYLAQEVYHCWLPSKFANLFEIVDIDGMGEGWMVESIYNELPTAVVLERGQDYKKTRKASDI